MGNKRCIPIFEVDEEMINLVSNITNKINTAKLKGSNLHLRKKNRLMSLQSTLAIENNTLSLKQVTDIINGKRVLGKMKEIKEVQNIYAAYEKINQYDPYNIYDLLEAHQYITSDVVSQSGIFRSGDVGIYDAKGNVVHIGARPQYIEQEMNRLFEWLKTSNAHPIIKSCVCHFELEVIHPFEDGNGRIGRLWQTVLLTNYNKIFEYMPIETVIYHNQKKYYDALNKSSKDNNSTEFVKFMLQIILKSFDSLNDKLTKIEKQIISLIEENREITIDLLVIATNKSKRTISRYLKKLKDNSVIRRIGSDKKGYWEII